MKFQTILNIILTIGLLYVGNSHYNLTKSLKRGITFEDETYKTIISSNAIIMQKKKDIRKSNFSFDDPKTIISVGKISMTDEFFGDSISMSIKTRDGMSIWNHIDKEYMRVNPTIITLNKTNIKADKTKIIDSFIFNVTGRGNGNIMFLSEKIDSNDKYKKHDSSIKFSDTIILNPN